METKLEYRKYEGAKNFKNIKRNKMPNEAKTDKRYSKRSLQAKAVADEVIRRYQAGEKINLQEIQISCGYSIKSAKSQRALQTKTYKDTVTPVLEKMSLIRDKALTSLLKRDVKNEKYNVLIDGIDKLTKNHQLLSGKSTENVANNIVVYGETDLMSKQVQAKE